MSERILNWALLADTGRISELGSGLRGKQARMEIVELSLWVGAVIGALFLAWLLRRVLAWRDGRGARNSPRALFRALCKAHALDRRQRRLLRQMARDQQLAHPAVLFVQPQRFDLDGTVPSASLQGDLSAALRRKLFGDVGQD